MYHRWRRLARDVSTTSFVPVPHQLPCVKGITTTTTTTATRRLDQQKHQHHQHHYVVVAMPQRNWYTPVPSGGVRRTRCAVRGRIHSHQHCPRRLRTTTTTTTKQQRRTVSSSSSLWQASSNNDKSPFVVLGIPKSATEQDVREAFRKVRERTKDKNGRKIRGFVLCW